ncbi:bifunctional phosphopantothenoylcysteine decarboxylase/phosphopantothenate--cysteine ligase CoaBC [Idiomarina sp. PL1-037]|uniref:bifunctional phosphopantothenoylcysteine decarboxylase/phosphopantothenate--cysteine ligase CoaBC n=1 Tax=Idiomarina sp. PL1-037 TaxID=3095365 RepID=UPI002ACC0F8F|nr:bifunctional phosphopantothenoylcysteine decarboxylase/phosphopantothenate--cysteine ligase CoaBC [Idiomarina sp. PL1-037]WQC53229.1 bifunctional phosphopantothenoylcysteine decarboxylase/phosphopantothenate--cysteine ligase CoaBC [Idiomarina sp. PL1-037]
MAPLQNKHILLGITGGIAAYKAPDLVRRLREQGAEVRVVLTAGAKAFVTPLSLQAVSGFTVSDDLLDPTAEAAMGHIELARWADLVLIAPASANTIARIAHGFADDLLSTLVLASKAPLAIAPAMNQQMWAATAVQENIETLLSRGVQMIGPESGEQACGDVGYGRMSDPTEIVQALIKKAPEAKQDWQGKTFVITAGPTREAIDPVRYISNHSSGKMGYALSEAAARAGAKVILVSGPTQLPTPAGVQRVDVETTEQMLNAVQQQLPNCDVFIGCAAVSDYRVAEVASQKIKKEQNNQPPQLKLVQNPDILQQVASSEKPPFTVGFAAETENLKANALRKLERKQLQMIIANDVSQVGLGFNSDSNNAIILSKDSEQSLPTMSKHDMAIAIIDAIAKRYFNTIAR